MFNAYTFSEKGMIKTNGSISNIFSHIYDRDTKFVLLDIFDPNDEELEFLEKKLEIHSLEIEDALNIEEQTIKAEEYKKHLFVNILVPKILKKEVTTEKISFFVFKKLIVVIRGKDYSLLEKTRARLQNRARYLTSSASVLHIFIDVVVDNLLLVVDAIDDEISDLETKLLKDAEELLGDIYLLKDKIITLRRILIPLKEVIYLLTKHSKFISSKQTLYFRDIYEHISIVISQLDLYRDATTNLIDLSLSLSSQKLNETMKILTAITTIFLPLTLITGIYGMNFKYMPELYYKYGYFFTLLFMFLLGSLLFYIFKRKNFL